MKDLGQLLVFVGKAGNVGRQVELDDQPFAGFDGGVLCFVETVGGDAHDIKGLHLVGDTFDKMHGAGAKGYEQLVKSMKMLKRHIDVGAADVIVKGIEDGIVLFVYLQVIFVLVKRCVLDDHMPSPPWKQIYCRLGRCNMAEV